MGFEVIIIVVIVSLAVGLSLYQFYHQIVELYQAFGRSFELAAWAGEHNYSFQWGRYPNWERQFPQFRGLRQGRDQRYAHNLIEGLYGECSFTAFDYHYQTYRYVEETSRGIRSRRKEPVHHYFSGVILRSPVPLKPLLVRPTSGLVQNLSTVFGSGGIEFESTAFNQDFAVQAADRRWAFDVLHQETLEYLLNQPRFTLDFQLDFVMAYQDQVFRPDDFWVAMDLILGVVHRIPSDVLHEHTNRDDFNNEEAV